MKLSIVSPEYKGEKMVPQLVQRIKDSVAQITDDFEIILVNDASPDNTWAAITEQCTLDTRVKGIELSRNFGQHYAITAGLANCSGDWIVVMDCDLQDRPEEIPNLYAKAQEGWDIVYARRVIRQDNWRKQFSSNAFHWILNKLSGMDTDKAIANFGIFRRNVIEEFNKMPETSRSMGSLLWYLGFKKTAIDVVHGSRAQGKTSYSLFKLLRLGSDIILANSNKPLRIAVSMGMLMSVISFAFAFYNIIAKLVGINTLQGFTSTIFSIWFVGGLILSMMGILGIYIGKIFDQVKDRPLYIIRTKLNFNDDCTE